ncbi:hypothetical protein B4098_0070 [Heyndrickxia coagulans]|uniref:Uncharacterized protein n=1 Tax=Heyndrickxia coagulans TaxID=1398 RepID=A0A150JR82_HEYCO|nr:hypothetical protein B4098_0070 [Heyndrickxia coagulans]
MFQETDRGRDTVRSVSFFRVILLDLRKEVAPWMVFYRSGNRRG